MHSAPFPIVLSAGCGLLAGGATGATSPLGAQAEKAASGPRTLTLEKADRRRFADAARAAFTAATGDVTSYTLEPKEVDGEPTIVSAKPLEAGVRRADDSTCRPLELSITKNGQTTTGTLTFCQAAGSSEIKLSGS